MQLQQLADLAPIVEPLLQWYGQDHRSLPWREDPTPYHVWLSEIMLQQTRIEAVIPYYQRFLAAFPTVADLAEADDERLMKLWEGLGYYSRARNLKRAAGIIMEEYGGALPPTYEALRALPGVGPYTAGAIASIAFGLPEPAVDGNVLRVVARLRADGRDVTKETTKKEVTEALRAIYPPAGPRAAAMTQAIMELGERICLPNGQPKCGSCPLGAACQARLEGVTDTIPYRAPKKDRKIQERTLFLLWYEGRVALCRRPETGLLSGLWEFPGVERPMSAAEAGGYLAGQGMEAERLASTPDARHIFTHIEWHMKGYLVYLTMLPATLEGRPLVWVTPQELRESYALPTAFRAMETALGEISMTKHFDR